MRKHRGIIAGLGKSIVAAVCAAILIPRLCLGNPSGPQVISGQAGFSTSGSTLTVTNSNGAIINWDSFSIAGNEVTRFEQPSALSSVLNRVTGNNSSAIYGTLQSNGKVFLVNPNGIFIGPTAKIDVNSFTASTLELSNSDFSAGIMNFTAGPVAGRIENQGAITTPGGGSIYLIAPDITNSGIITAPNGDILLAAGHQVNLADSSDPDMAVVVSAPENQALNLGHIIAEAGRIGISSGLVTQKGIVRADSAIVNRDGSISFRASGAVTLDRGSVTTANGSKGGSITVQSGGDVNVNDVVTWSDNRLTLSAGNNININADLNATDSASLVLEYGQGAVSSGNTSSIITNSAVINLPAGTTNFTTRHGSDGIVKNYTVITSLGEAGSATATDLQGMNGGLATNYAVGAHIDATATSSWNNGAGFMPVGADAARFSGTFDGLGHTIGNLAVNMPSSDSVGLFGATSADAVIRNITLEGAALAGNSRVGGVAGDNQGVVTNSRVSGIIRAASHGGGVAGINAGIVNNSFSSATVISNGMDVGGLVGNNSGAIRGSFSSGSVISDGNNIGGLAGTNMQGGVISESYSTAGVTGSGLMAGGLVGSNSGVVSNSYSSGTVEGYLGVGGLAGFNEGSIDGSYTSGVVNGDFESGGLVGLNLITSQAAAITNSYWDKSLNAALPDNGVGIALTTAEFMDPGTLSGLGFSAGDGNSSASWWLSESNTRPFLRSEWSPVVTNAHQLQLMAMRPGENYVLANNIDMAELSRVSGMWNTAKGFVPVGDDITPFTGRFDGLKHTIGNLKINLPSKVYAGLFGYTGSDAMIGNVGLIDATVTGGASVGALAGRNNGSIDHAYSTGTITETGDGLPASAFGGGLAGYNAGSITNSYSTGRVSGTDFVGGLVGYNSGTVGASYAAGSVSGWYGVGGLAGSNGGRIGNSYATGSVTGNSRVGGLAGLNELEISNSYATGSVSGSSYSGGLVGDNAGSVADSFWNRDVTATGIAAGTTTGATGLTAAQMKKLSYFTGWNTASPNTISNMGGSGAVWRIYEGHTAPLLAGLLTPLTLSDAPDVTVMYNGASQSGTASPLRNNVFGAAATGRNAGFYNGYYSTQSGYDITGGNLTVAPRVLTASLDTGSSTYGSPLKPGAIRLDNVIPGDVVTPGAVVVDSTGLTSTSGNLKAGTHVGIQSAGTALGGADAANYVFEGASGDYVVTPAVLTVSATGVNKVYDGTTAATVILADNRISGDILTLDGSATFLDKNAASGKTVTVSGITATGVDAGNYTFTAEATTRADISRAILTVSATGANKVYDGNRTATVTLADDRVSGDVLTVNNARAEFTDKHAASGKTVTVSGITVAGADAGNYTFNTETTTRADITPARLTVSATGANKVYDGTPAATVTLADDRISGDVLTVNNDRAEFTDINPGTGKTIIVSGIAASGPDAGNYVVNTVAETVADITPPPVVKVDDPILTVTDRTATDAQTAAVKMASASPVSTLQSGTAPVAAAPSPSAPEGEQMPAAAPSQRGADTPTDGSGSGAAAASSESAAPAPASSGTGDAPADNSSSGNGDNTSSSDSSASTQGKKDEGKEAKKEDDGKKKEEKEEKKKDKKEGTKEEKKEQAKPKKKYCN